MFFHRPNFDDIRFRLFPSPVSSQVSTVEEVLFSLPLNSSNQIIFLNLFLLMWKARNLFIFQGHQISVNFIVISFFELQKSCQIKFQKVEVFKHVIKCSWSPPPLICVALNVNGSVNGATGIAGFGCMLRANNGSFIQIGFRDHWQNRK